MVGSKKMKHMTHTNPLHFHSHLFSIIFKEVILLLDCRMCVVQTDQSRQLLKVHHGLFSLTVPDDNIEKYFYHIWSQPTDMPCSFSLATSNINQCRTSNTVLTVTLVYETLLLKHLSHKFSGHKK